MFQTPNFNADMLHFLQTCAETATDEIKKLKTQTQPHLLAFIMHLFYSPTVSVHRSQVVE